MIRRFSLRLLLGFLLLVPLPLGALAWLYSDSFEQNLRATALDALVSIANKKTDQINTYLNERLADIELLSRSRTVRNLLSSPLGQTSEDNQLWPFFERAGYHDLLVIDADGQVCESIRREPDLGTNLLSGPYRDSDLARAFKEAMALLDTQLTSAAPYAASNGRPAIFIVTPVLDAGLPIGAVALQLDLEELTRVTSDGTGLGESGETVLAQLDGDSALYVGPLRHVADAAFRYRVALPEVAEPMRAALAGDHGQGLTRDYAGVPIIAVWRHLPALRWGMVVKMDIAEAFAPVHGLRARTLGALALLLLTATLIALVYSRGLLASIRQLLDATKRIAAGDLEHQAEVRGCSEFRQLAQSFNRMAARIRHEQERLEERVEQRTQELQRSQAAYEELTRRLPVGVYSLRGSATEIGDFTYVSDRFCELMRTPREILLADSSSAFAQVHPDAMADFLALNCQRMSDLQPFVWEGPFFIHGRQRWFRIESLPSPQADGGVLWNGVLSDISARKAIEEALIEAKQQAEAASRAKSDFLANMSHEIRTPLNAILGFSQLAMEDGLEPRQHELLKKSHEAAHSLLGTFNDILDYAKIEAGRIALERHAFSLSGLLGDLANSLRGRAAEKGLDLRIDIAPELPDELIGDPQRLTQVLRHLVGNAMKFTERGHIQIKVSGQALDDARILLGFSVRDTGIGFRADQVELLFQPFSQADSSITRRYGGTGLGLTISRQLVALMGGELSAQGEEGVGATFRFSVPVETLDAQAVDSTSARPHGAGLEFAEPLHAPLSSQDLAEARELLAALQPILRDAGLVPDPLLERLRALATREQPPGEFRALLHEIERFNHEAALKRIARLDAMQAER